MSKNMNHYNVSKMLSCEEISKLFFQDLRLLVSEYNARLEVCIERKVLQSTVLMDQTERLLETKEKGTRFLLFNLQDPRGKTYNGTAFNKQLALLIVYLMISC